MHKEHSEVERLAARNEAAGRPAASLVTQLGDVKIETRFPTGSDVIDNLNPVEHYDE